MRAASSSPPIAPGAWLAGLLASVALAAHARSYLPFFAGDALISLRYARRLAQGRGLTWNDGEWVEGYSNLLWVLLVAAGARLGLDPIEVARGLGLLCGLVVIGGIVHTLGRGTRPTLAVGLAAGLWAGTGSVAAWTLGGLEQPLVAAGVTTAVAALWPGGVLRPRLAGLALAALCLTRPDGPVWVAGVLAAVGISQRAALRARGDLAWLLGLPTVAVVAQSALRWDLYGALVPNTARVKLAWHPTRRAQGLEFVLQATDVHAVLLCAVALAALAAWRWRDLRPTVALLTAPALAWTLYVWLMGGDGVTFPAWRHAVPVVPLAALAAGVLIARAPLPSGLGLGVAVGALAGHVHLQRLDPHDALRATRNEEVLADAQQAAQALELAFGATDPLLAVTAAGGLPYFTGFRALDMLGLTDAALARHRPRDFGGGWMGHELHDAEAVLARAPDLVLLGMPPGREVATHPVGEDLFALPGWATYALVFLEGPVVSPQRPVVVWVATAGRAGVQRAPDEVVLPAVLLGTRPDRPAVVGSQDPPSLLASPEDPAFLDRLTLDPGSWTLTIDAPPPMRARLRDEWGTTIAVGLVPLSFDHAGGVVRLDLWPDALPTPVHGARFARSGDASPPPPAPSR